MAADTRPRSGQVGSRWRLSIPAVRHLGDRASVTGAVGYPALFAPMFSQDVVCEDDVEWLRIVVDPPDGSERGRQGVAHAAAAECDSRRYTH